MGFQNESIEAVPDMELEKMQESGAELGTFGLSSDVLENLKEVEAESADLSPAELKMKELQEERQGPHSHGIVGDVIEKIQEVAEDIVDGIKDFFDGPDEQGEFDKAEFQESVDEAAKEWHVQTEDYSCAIACQQFIINEFKDVGISEQELIDFAREQGWYQEFGTTGVDIGNFLTMYDIDTTVKATGEFQDLLDATDNGDRVIVTVQNMALVTEWCDGYPYGSANHAVEVLGIDRSDPENLKVIVNDPGVEDGRAKAISYENFMDAWSTGGGFMVVAHKD